MQRQVGNLKFTMASRVINPSTTLILCGGKKSASARFAARICPVCVLVVGLVPLDYREA
jgi:hypothetical protein